MKKSIITAILFLFCASLAPALRAQISQQTINVVSDLGVHNDGTNATFNYATLMNAFYLYPNAKIIFPPGNYAIDNSPGAIPITNFNGEIKCEGGAVLLFQDNTQGGLRFTGGAGMRIVGLHGRYPNNPTLRLATHFAWTGGTDLFIRDIVVDNSPGAGILITSVVRPKVINATVSNTLADGLAFANCTEAQLTSLTTANTRDNALAFYDYAALAEGAGGMISNVHVYQSYAHGIAVVGTSDVTVSGFVIDTTRGSAVFSGQDPTYATRVSDKVIFEHGLIQNAGTLLPRPTNTYGIEYNQPISVTFSDIRILNNTGRAVSGNGVSSRIYMRNIRSENNTETDAFVFYRTAFVDISDCLAVNSPGNGFTFNQVPLVIARRLKTVNVSQSNALHRAIWFQDGAQVAASDLMVADYQSIPTGYIVGTSNSPGYIESGSIHSVLSAIVNGALKVQNYAANVKFSDIN